VNRQENFSAVDNLLHLDIFLKLFYQFYQEATISFLEHLSKGYLNISEKKSSTILYSIFNETYEIKSINRTSIDKVA